MIHQSIAFAEAEEERAPSAAPGGAQLGPVEFAAIAEIMKSDARIHLIRAKSTLVQSRLARRLREHGLNSYREYVDLVRSDPEERATMVIALTTNHTHFFRESHHFDHLRDLVRPRLQAQARTRPVRIWSAGCSTGEEVYSIAMTLLGEDPSSAAWLGSADVRLLATDIAPHVVESTRRAIYPAAAVKPIPAPYRRSWLRRAGSDFTVANEARQLVGARELNLFADWPMRRQYDVIFCRNVMIYFDDDAKAELEARFVDLLAPGGFLYIGHSERLIGSAARRMESCGHTIYAKPGDAA